MSKFDDGMKVRREVLGDAHVDRSMANATRFDADFQEYITKTVWTRDGLERHTRHLVTIGILAALGREHELELHLHSTINTGVTPEQLREVFMHVGVPAANTAFALAKKILREQHRLEVWQADSTGRFNHESDPEHALADPNFSGFGRSPTDANGAYWFRTIKPGSRDGTPQINLRLFMRGLLIHLVIRIYLADEPNDALPNSLEPGSRSTLIATKEDGADGLTYRFDIHLQGELETVFFDV
jgi:4-carboxymuconolactone decarboxylase